MNKSSLIAKTLGLTLLMLSLFINTFAIPPIKRPNELKSAVMEGWAPATVDPAWCNDEASKQLIFNIYDTLMTFDGEHMDAYLPSIATKWTVQNITGETSPEGLSWYYRYIFEIRTGVKFHNNETLNTTDVEYSFERAMVQDRAGGPAWMFYEPLLYVGTAYDLGDIGNATNPGPDVQTVGLMIDHAVESNATHVWFNLAFPGAYGLFMQIVSQTWSSILSKAWINNYVIGNLGRPDWSGNWMLEGNHTEWINHHDPDTSPLDDPILPLMMGSGPFKLTILDYGGKYWTVERNVDYWRGWPADWPKLMGTRPAGYVDTFTVTWAYVWETRSVMFLNGDVDFCDIPRQYIAQIQNKDGIRMIGPLLSFSLDALFYTFDISPLTSYGKIYGYGDFSHGDGIPRDFFGGAGWGIHIRKAFSYAFDYNTYLSVAWLNEATQPPTAIIPGLPYYDPTLELEKYYYNLTRAAEEFLKANATTNLWNVGFTVVLTYNTGNLPRKTACDLLATAIKSINNKFNVLVTSADWKPYLGAMQKRQLSAFITDWHGAYPDPHGYAYPFYHTNGTFSTCQAYSNGTIDAKIEAGILEPDGPEREPIYHDVQVMALDDCPSVPLSQAIGRHFERDWVVDWYYNPMYSYLPTYQGIYAYPLWKEYYVPHSLYDSSTQPISNRLPSDVNYDGVINFLDLYAVKKAFSSDPGPPIHPRWNFRCDIDNNRIIDMPDVSRVGRDFWKGVPNPVHGGDIYLVAEPYKTNVSIGYNVNITVGINDVTDFTGYEVRILYDSNLLELLEFNYTAASGWTSTEGDHTQMIIGDKNCTAVYTWMQKGSPFSGNTTLAKFTFKGAAKGNATLDISTSILATGSPMLATPYNPVNCEVRITMLGDVNADGKVNMADIGYVARRFMCIPGDPLWDPNADITSDGIINMMDIGIVARHFMEVDP